MALMRYQEAAPPAHLREMNFERWWCSACNSAVDSPVAMLRHCTGRAHEQSLLLLQRMNDKASLMNLAATVRRAQDEFTRDGGDMLEFIGLPDMHMVHSAAAAAPAEPAPPVPSPAEPPGPHVPAVPAAPPVARSTAAPARPHAARAVTGADEVSGARAGGRVAGTSGDPDTWLTPTTARGEGRDPNNHRSRKRIRSRSRRGRASSRRSRGTSSRSSRSRSRSPRRSRRRSRSRNARDYRRRAWSPSSSSSSTSGSSSGRIDFTGRGGRRRSSSYSRSPRRRSSQAGARAGDGHGGRHGGVGNGSGRRQYEAKEPVRKSTKGKGPMVDPNRLAIRLPGGALVRLTCRHCQRVFRSNSTFQRHYCDD